MDKLFTLLSANQKLEIPCEHNQLLTLFEKNNQVGVSYTTDNHTTTQENLSKKDLQKILENSYVRKTIDSEYFAYTDFKQESRRIYEFEKRIIEEKFSAVQNKELLEKVFELASRNKTFKISPTLTLRISDPTNTTCKPLSVLHYQLVNTFEDNDNKVHPNLNNLSMLKILTTEISKNLNSVQKNAEKIEEEVSKQDLNRIAKFQKLYSTYCLNTKTK